MNYQTIFYDNMLNGEGLRVILWLSGCSHHCPGCHNPETHDPNSGAKFTRLVKEKIFDELRKDYIDGITLTGGDPLFLSSREEVSKLVHEIKKKFPTKTIWMYTGFLYEEVSDMDIFQENLVDVLLDGKYIAAEHEAKLMYVGSKNQRIIDVKKSNEAKKVVLYLQNHEKQPN